jgi:NAD(P)-dependent dehydrogenase (short-subunit alcohol dehydrogenase family)
MLLVCTYLVFLSTTRILSSIMMSPGSAFIGKELKYGFGVTSDGFEQHIGVNHVGHFHLLQLLTPTLKASAPARVVILSSSSSKEAPKPAGILFDTWMPSAEHTASNPPPEYEDGFAYGQSKLANLLTAREYSARMEGTGVTAYSVHPGVIQTNLFEYMATEMEKHEVNANLAEKAFGALFNAMFQAALLNQVRNYTCLPFGIELKRWSASER